MIDVARLAGVDVSLVSRVINEDPKLNILPTTRERILEAIRESGYRRNFQARGLRRQRAFTIGFLLPEVTNPIYGPIVSGAVSRADARGYLVVLGSTAGHNVAEPSFEDLLGEKRVDGLLIASGELSDARMRELRLEAAPIVFVNRRIPGTVGSVTVDDAAGSALATQALVDLGHRRLAHLAGATDIDTAARRREGFVSAVTGAGLTDWVIEVAGDDAQGGFDAASRLIDQAPTTTGIIAMNSLVATGAVRALGLHGLRVPDDVSVVSVNDHPLAEFITPTLSCVRMPLERMGATSVDSLLARIDGGAAEDTMVTGDMTLCLRESAGPPPAAQRSSRPRRRTARIPG
ncbi:MAG: LacI family DNA-binding transcriptional regulator [Chloroflexi bacterium]|nr:LacI family DNA-binding transcriptional regulator [Chloroflexota bacterium]